jgi:hypothetical protein
MTNLPSKFRSLLMLAALPGCFVATPDDDAEGADTDDMEDTANDDDDVPNRDTLSSESSPVSATGADADDDGGSEDEEGGDVSMTSAITSADDDDSTGGSDDEGGSVSMTSAITSGGDDDTGGSGEGEELLTNGSFEDWSGGMPDAWTNGDATLEEVVGDAADGERSVRVSSAIYNSLGQYVSTPLEAGSCLELDVSVRSESGSTQAPMVLLQGTDEGGTDVQIFIELDWATDGAWRTTASEVVTAEAWTAFSFNVLSNDSVPQVFVVDDASVRLVPCE